MKHAAAPVLGPGELRRVAVALVAALAVGCGRADSARPDGTEGGACFPNDTCFAPFLCSASHVCVSPGCAGAGCFGPCPANMVQVNDNLCIDAYEASVFENADCTGQQYGVGQDDYPAGFPEHVASSGCEAECAAHSTEAQTQAVYACSIGGVMPSTMLTWFRAKAACENAGKALCASGEWMAACGGPDGTQYPFGASWAGQCNTVYDMRAALVTGADPACVGGMPGLFDMGGNVAEWVNACGSTDCQYYGGSFNQSEDFLECANPDSLTATAAFGDLGFRCCARLRE